MLTSDYFSVFGCLTCIAIPCNRCLVDCHFTRSETRVWHLVPMWRNTLAVLDECICTFGTPIANYTKPTLKGKHCTDESAEPVPANERRGSGTHKE